MIYGQGKDKPRFDLLDKYFYNEELNQLCQWKQKWEWIVLQIFKPDNKKVWRMLMVMCNWLSVHIYKILFL